VKNALIDIVTLTFDLSTLKIIPFIGYNYIVIPYNKSEHFGIIRF